MRKILLTLLILGALGAAGVMLFGERLLLAAMQRQVSANLSGANFAQFPDGLNVVLCGAGSPMPDLKRSGPCVAVIAGPQVIVVDVGSGAVRNLTPSGIQLGRIEAVLLTHFHSDHIDGLGELMLQRWAGGGRDTPTPVYGPEGVERVVAGFNMAYTADFGYRVGHHGPQIVKPTGAGGIAHPFPQPAEGESPVIYEHAGLKITAFVVQHPPIVPAVGYRFDYKGRSVVISGDTLKSANIERAAQGADLLLHEALAPQLVAVMTAGAHEAHAKELEQITRDILDYHATPVQAAQSAQIAGVRHLLYYHIVPPLPLQPLERIFLRGVSDVYSGGVTLGRDRTWISLPAGSTEIRVGRRD